MHNMLKARYMQFYSPLHLVSEMIKGALCSFVLQK